MLAGATVFQVRMGPDEDLFGNLVEAYRQSITSLDWMQPETKKQALEKLTKFTTKIGYPDKWRDYTGLAIRADDLLGNVQRAQRFESDFQVANSLARPSSRRSSNARARPARCSGRASR